MNNQQFVLLVPVVLAMGCGMGDAELGSGPGSSTSPSGTDGSTSPLVDAATGVEPDASTAADAALADGAPSDVSSRTPDANAGDGSNLTPDGGTGSTILDGDATAPTPAAVVLFGGTESGGPGIGSDTWEWDGANWTNRGGGFGPSARTGAAMAPIGDKVVLFGGFNGLAPLGDTWEWDGAVWTQIDISGPTPRSGALMAGFDGKVILFGGTTTGSGWDLFDTWSFDGASWTSFDTSGNPGGGWGMASSSADGCDAEACQTEPLVLFGAGASENQTWAWNGAPWAQVDVAASNSNAYPLPGQGVVAGVGDSILLLETSAPDSANPNLTTTWQWIAGAWTDETQVVSPRVEPGTTMTSLGDSAVLFWGFQGETWIWSAGQWSQAVPATSPSTRQGQAMATRFAP